MTRVKLVEAGNARDDRWAQCWYAPESRRFLVPLLALPTLAGMLPRDWDIEIVDEKLRDIDLNADADLVCLSFKSKDAKRAYRYADAFRARNIPVILGGVHATSLPDEAAEHADAVVVGEAEGIFPQVIDDFRAGRLQQLYRSPPSREIGLDSVPMPRFDLIDHRRYCLHAVQTSRGCLVGCEFCPVQKMFGGISRHKSLARVLAEIEAVRAIDPHKDIFFVDEMFCGGDLDFQKELLRELRRRRSCVGAL
ncbi:MAG: radical SAM protein, partial [Gemmataceae bacterium]